MKSKPVTLDLILATIVRFLGATKTQTNDDGTTSNHAIELDRNPDDPLDSLLIIPLAILEDCQREPVEIQIGEQKTSEFDEIPKAIVIRVRPAVEQSRIIRPTIVTH